MQRHKISEKFLKKTDTLFVSVYFFFYGNFKIIFLPKIEEWVDTRYDLIVSVVLNIR